MSSLIAARARAALNGLPETGDRKLDGIFKLLTYIDNLHHDGVQDPEFGAVPDAVLAAISHVKRVLHWFHNMPPEEWESFENSVDRIVPSSPVSKFLARERPEQFLTAIRNRYGKAGYRIATTGELADGGNRYREVVIYHAGDCGDECFTLRTGVTTESKLILDGVFSKLSDLHAMPVQFSMGGQPRLDDLFCAAAALLPSSPAGKGIDLRACADWFVKDEGLVKSQRERKARQLVELWGRKLAALLLWPMHRSGKNQGKNKINWTEVADAILDLDVETHASNVRDFIETMGIQPNTMLQPEPVKASPSQGPSKPPPKKPSSRADRGVDRSACTKTRLQKKNRRR